MTRRRDILRLAAAFAVSPVITSATGLALPALRGGFSPPLVPMVLERVLRRELMDGEAIIVTRRWKVRFEKAGRGFALSGKQMSASVEAPPSLGALALLEERRVEEHQFPMMLDGAGIIGDVGGAQLAEGGPSELSDAIALAVRQVAPETGRTAQHYLTSLSRSAEALISHLPPDLFFPNRLGWTTQRSIALPDGGTGEVELRFDAKMAPSGTVMEQATRRIITRIGNSQRASAEAWTLTLAA